VGERVKRDRGFSHGEAIGGSQEKKKQPKGEEILRGKKPMKQSNREVETSNYVGLSERDENQAPEGRTH